MAQNSIQSTGTGEIDFRAFQQQNYQLSYHQDVHFMDSDKWPSCGGLPGHPSSSVVHSQPQYQEIVDSQQFGLDIQPGHSDITYGTHHDYPTIGQYQRPCAFSATACQQRSLEIFEDSDCTIGDCDECDDPECKGPDFEDTVECTDRSCTESLGPATCHDGVSTICAGHLSPDVVDGAFHLSAIRGSSGLSSNFCHPEAHLTYAGMVQVGGHQVNFAPSEGIYHGSGIQTFALRNGHGFCAGGESCTWQAPSDFQPSMGCHHFGVIDTLNQAHFYHHHLAQTLCHQTVDQSSPMTGLSSLSSPVSNPTQQTAFEFSQESTPLTPQSSPHQTPIITYGSFSLDQYHSQAMIRSESNESMVDIDRDSEHVCQWDLGKGEVCGHRFDDDVDLQKHVREAHIKTIRSKDNFFCRWQGCSRPSDKPPFAQRSKLERHCQSHTGYKACFCGECNVRFSTQQTYESHLRTHTGERPYVCTVSGCNYSSAQASQLTMHTRSRHTKVKPLKCDWPGCKMTFAESSNLSKHRKTHEPAEPKCCPRCHKRFNRPDQLKRHMKTHAEKVQPRKKTGSKTNSGAALREWFPEALPQENHHAVFAVQGSSF